MCKNQYTHKVLHWSVCFSLILGEFLSIWCIWTEGQYAIWVIMTFHHHATVSSACILGCLPWSPVPWFNIKMSSYQNRKSHCGDKTVVRSSYLHNGIYWWDDIRILNHPQVILWATVLLVRCSNELDMSFTIAYFLINWSPFRHNVYVNVIHVRLYVIKLYIICKDKCYKIIISLNMSCLIFRIICFYENKTLQKSMQPSPSASFKPMTADNIIFHAFWCENLYDHISRTIWWCDICLGLRKMVMQIAWRSNIGKKVSWCVSYECQDVFILLCYNSRNAR